MINHNIMRTTIDKVAFHIWRNRTVGGDLKKDAAGLPEIEGAKPEAVDHWRDGDAARRYGLLPALLFRGIWRTPGHVMDCAHGDAPSPLARLRAQGEQRSRPTLPGPKTHAAV